MSEKLDFLGGETPAETDSHAATSDAAADTAQRAEHADAGSSPAGADVLEPGREAAPASGQVPISALLDEREKRQAERAAREVLERQVAELRARQAPPPALTRDEHMEVALYGQNLRASRRFAEREYGKEQVAKVHAWAADRCDADPAFNQQMRDAEDPYESAYQAFSREQVLARVTPGDLDEYEAWKAAKAAGQPPAAHPHGAAVASAAATPPRTTLSPPVPRSLATASGTGAAGAPHTPIGPGQAFHSVITRSHLA